MPENPDIFYNEWDQDTASWLSELTKSRALPAGKIDTRSITELHPEDVKDFKQCHFFAGIGGWPLALRWAGLEGVPGIWTGSPPCQPFSSAGKHLGKADARHLSPTWLTLIRACRPRLIFGEQVADAIRHGWLDDLFDELEDQDYTCKAAVLPACGVGAPHERSRLFFTACRLADMHENGCEQRQPLRLPCAKDHTQHGSAARLLSPDDGGRSRNLAQGQDPRCAGAEATRGVENHGLWTNVDWVGCRDNTLRPVKSGISPLVNGLPKGMGRGCVESLEDFPAAAEKIRLRGYGNAIVPQLAAVFIRTFLDSQFPANSNHGAQRLATTRAVAPL